jgi:hypothetical protein
MATKREDEDLLNPGGEPDVDPAKKPLTVSLDDDSDDAPDADAPETPETRKGRRSQYRELRESNKRMEQELAELKGRLSAPAPIVVQAPAQQQTPQVDPLEAADEEAYEQQQATLRALSTPGLAPAEDERLRKQYRALERKRHEIGAEAAARRVAARQPQADAQAPERAVLAAAFPKVFEKMSLRAEATERVEELARTRRVPVSIALAQEVCEQIYVERGFRAKPPAATDTERARHTGVSSRPAAANGGGGKFTPDKSQERYALAMYSHRNDLTDEQKVRLYHDRVLKPARLA